MLGKRKRCGPARFVRCASSRMVAGSGTASNRNDGAPTGAYLRLPSAMEWREFHGASTALRRLGRARVLVVSVLAALTAAGGTGGGPAVGERQQQDREVARRRARRQRLRRLLCRVRRTGRPVGRGRDRGLGSAGPGGRRRPPADGGRQPERRPQATVLWRASSYQPFWVANTILVRSGSDALGPRPWRRIGNVTRLRSPQTYSVPTPDSGHRSRSTIDAVEWGIDRIRADEVWSTFGVRGEGIVGGQHRHRRRLRPPGARRQVPRQHRRRHVQPQLQLVRPVQRLRHPSLAPCDNNNHGTHTMGTMVGDDGGANQIGVAPGARWIAAKGCETNSCSDAALLASGQWMLAPTDLGWTEPAARPAAAHRQQLLGRRRRRHLVPRHGQRLAGRGHLPGVLQRQRRPGLRHRRLARRLRGGVRLRRVRHQQRDRLRISSRGRGRRSGSSRTSPRRASTSGRPINGGGYAAFNGTSMASPHTAGTVALMWSAAPSLIGDIDPDGGAAEPDRGRHQRPDLRRHRGEQQRLGRGQARRARRGRRSRREARSARSTARSPTPARALRSPAPR